jgi:galactoside O-acetyltransferase
MKKWNFNRMGSNIKIYDPVTFISTDLITLNNNIIISEFTFINAGLGLFIGNYIHISPFTSISGGGYCVMEDFVGLSAGVRLITGSDDYSGKALTNPTIPSNFRNINRSYVHCKKHSLLATNVIVHPGITIGEGAVAASNSVITKDLDPWSVYMGTPAKKVKERDRDKILTLEKELKDNYNYKNSDYTSFIKLNK